MSISTIPARADSFPLSQRLFNRQDLIPPPAGILWRIKRGVVRTVTVSEQGTLICLGYWGSGDIIGHRLSRLDPYQICCSTNVEVSMLPPELWHQVLDGIALAYSTSRGAAQYCSPPTPSPAVVAIPSLVRTEVWA